MICFNCQREIAEHSTFCYLCGARQSAPTASPGVRRRLMRSATDEKIAGVCGGIAEYMDTDSTIVRLIWAVLSIVPGGFVGGVLAYLIAWFIMPKAPLPLPASAGAPSHATQPS